ncbi:MAG: peptidase, partial [Nitrospina sp.]
VAVQMEATFSKDEILEAYCNQVYFGSGAYGVEEAAQVYFGRRAKDLTLLQAAMLAGLPNSPNSANPFSNFDRAMRRAETVLKRMKKSNFIGFSEMHEATRSDLALAAPIKISNSNQYFINFVIQRMEKQYGKEFVHFGGLKVFTTLDSRYQSFAYQAAERHLKSLDRIMEKKEAPSKLQVAVVVLENKTGAVRVLLGGRKFSESQFNRAVSNNRLPGSSFKPVVYLSAMENLGLSPASSIVDEPTTFLIPGSQPWEPQNFNGKYYGPVILKKALMSSINVISAKMVYELTPRRVIKTARQLGIVSPLGDNLSLALGTSGVSSLEMAGVYSVIANLGILNEPYFIQRIEDYRGKPIYEHFYYGVQRFSAKTIYPLLDMMRGVVDGGSGRVIRRLGFKHPAGGKTGTSNDFKDGWFNGFTKDYSSSVWVGYDNNNSMIDKNGKGLTGSRVAAPIWAQLMKKVLEGKSPANFPVPQGIRFADVDFRTGFLANSDTSGKLNVAVKEEVVLTLPRPIETDLLGTELEGQSGVTFPRELNGLSEF